MRRGSNRTQARRKTRGSTLLLVLGMLSVLVLVAAGLAYTSRIEGTASANFAQAAQARMAANTGLPYSLTLLDTMKGAPTSPLQAWAQVPAALQQTARTIGGSAQGLTAKTAPGFGLAKALSDSGLDQETLSTVQEAGVPPANVTITDLSGLVNINTIKNDKALARTLQAVLGNSETKGVSAETRAKAVLALRSPGTGKGRPTSTSAATEPGMQDPRLGQPSLGMRRIETLDELGRKGADGQTPLFSESDIEKLRHALTVFSQAPEVYHRDDGTSVPKLSLAAATAPEVLQVLRQAFPEKDDRLLCQYAANVADALDEDSVPTLLNESHAAADTSTSGSASRGLEILGVEAGAPFITEVYPDSKTGADYEDAGQFVEIYNPWPQPLVMAGWRLEIGGGSSVNLNVVIPSGGSAVITDNYSTPGENAPAETGSLVSIFGVQADGAQRKVVEDSTCVLPDQDSYVRLLDEAGNLVDVFAWGGEAGADSTTSYQRNDPRVRAGTVQQGTPFEHRAGVQQASVASTYQSVYARAATSTGAATADSQAVAAAFSEVKSFAVENGSKETTGTWLRSPVDLLSVSTAYAALEGSSSSAESAAGQLTAYAWQRPDRKRQEEEKKTNLDLRVIDLFTSVKGEADSTSSTQSEELADGAGALASRSAAGAGRSGSLAAPATFAGSRGNEAPRVHSMPVPNSYLSGQSAAGFSASSRAAGQGSARASLQGAPSGVSPDRAAALQAINAFSEGSLPLIGAEDRVTSLSLPTLFAYGRINLNTASRVTLNGLDGEVDGKEHLTAEHLQKIELHKAERLKEHKVPFENVSDLLALLFPDASDTQLRVFAKLAEQVTVDSCAFEITSENRVTPTDSARRQPWAQARWTVSLDREPYSLLDYSSRP